MRSKGVRPRRIRLPWMITSLFGLIVGLVIGGVVLNATAGARASALRADQSTRTIKAVVAAAENLEVAFPYPLPVLAQTSAVNPPQQIFRPNVAPHAWVNEVTKKADIPSAVRSESLRTLRGLVGRLFTPTLAAQIVHLAGNTLSEESGGNYVAGSAWAKVLDYRSVVADATTASVQAVVASWSLQGWVNSTTGRVTWSRNKNEILVTDVLARTRGGQWLITSRQWQFMPGYAP
jgi:hypothetical protein